ncbi:MFS transporter [archaeon]|nr:MFS transporter [archaeon]
MHITHSHVIKTIFKKELREIYIAIALKTLAMSMIGIFIPIYLIDELGYPFEHMLFFYLIWVITSIIMSPIIAKFSAKYGVKHSIFVSAPLFIIFIALLESLKFNIVSPWIVAIFFAFPFLFFWIGLHIDFAKFSDKKIRTKEVSVFHFLMFLSIIIGPILGGLIINYFNFLILFLVSSLLFIASVVPLLFSKDIHEPTKFSFKYIFKKEHFKDLMIFISLGIKHITEIVFLPVFIFLILKQYLLLGAVYTISNIIPAIATLIMGKYGGKDRKKLIKIGAVLNMISWFLVSFIKTAFQTFFVVTLLGTSLTIMSVPHNSLVYEKAAKKNTSEYIVFREISISLGRGIGLVILLITSNFIYNFALAGISNLSFLFLL